MYRQLAPGPTSKKYGVDDTVSNRGIIRCIGANLLSVFAVAWCVVINDYDIYTATAASSWPWIVEWLTTILNGEPKKCGYSPYVPYLLLAVSSSNAAFSSMRNEAVATVMRRVSTFSLFFHAIGFTVLPAITSAIRDSKIMDNEETSFLLRTFGCTCAHFGVLSALLDFGKMDPIRALGYATAVQTATLMATIIFDKKFASASTRHLYMGVGSAWLAFLMLRGDQGGTEQSL